MPTKKDRRLTQFERAHTWRLALAEIAKEKGLSVKALSTPKGGRERVDLAAEVSERVGFSVPYHSVWKFTCGQRELLASYMEGKPPSPEEQLASAVTKMRAASTKKNRGANRAKPTSGSPAPAPAAAHAKRKTLTELVSEIGRLDAERKRIAALILTEIKLSYGV